MIGATRTNTAANPASHAFRALYAYKAAPVTRIIPANSKPPSHRAASSGSIPVSPIAASSDG